MILTNISTPLLGLVDTVVLGHLDSEKFLAAVALGGLIFSFIFWGFGFLRMGTTGLTARAFGEDNIKEINAVLARSMVLAIVISSLLLILHQGIAFASFWLLQSSMEVEQLALQYFEIRILSSPATLCLYVLMGWFLGQQNVKIPLLVVLITNITNICLDILLVYYFKMQVEGVALATVFAEYTGLCIALIITIRVLKKNKAPFCWHYLCDFKKIKAMLLINSHIFVRTWCVIFTFAFFTAQAAKMGDMILAANTVLLNFQTFMAYALDGFAHAAEALVGKAVGAKNRAMVRQAVLTTGLWSLLAALLFTAFYLLFGLHIIDLLTGLENVRKIAYIYLPWLIAMPVLSFLCYLFDGVFIGAMMTKEMRNTMMFSLFCVFLPVWYFTQAMGNQGLWSAPVASSACPASAQHRGPGRRNRP
jgi:MATE family multidrug resistance protein